jgi:pyruvate-formate lyase-activating enzyme
MRQTTIKLVIPIENELSYNSIPRNKNLNLDIKNHCNAPSRQLVIDWKGDCFVCGCEAWLPISVGQILNFTSLAQVWDSPGARALQADIDSRAYTHCAVDRCGVIYSSKIDKTHVVSINVDESCNLRCPSCRPNAIMIGSGEEYDRKLVQVQHIRKLLEEFTEPCLIVMSGNGDPLASAIMRPLIRRFQPGPNQTIRLFTNGLLLKKQLDDSPILNHITQYFISIDAGSADVYERVRLGGQWSQLIDNLNWLQDTANRTGAKVLLKFVLQQDNYQDLQNFCRLCVDMEFSGIINRLEDWGTWANYAEHDVVGNTNHKNHSEAMHFLGAAYSEYAGRIQFNPSLIELCL